MLAVRWYLRSGLSYRDPEELLGERGIEVDHHLDAEADNSGSGSASLPLGHRAGLGWSVAPAILIVEARVHEPSRQSWRPMDPVVHS